MNISAGLQIGWVLEVLKDAYQRFQTCEEQKGLNG
jgi:hypothetical protein